MRDMKGPSSGSGVRDQIADTNNRLTSIETQLAQLKGVDEDLEHRLAQLEGDVQAVRGGVAPGGLTPPGVPGGPGTMPGPGGEEGSVPPSTGARDQFDAAMRSYREGRYQESDTFFSEYIRENPRSPKIEDAYFYKAESQFAQGNYEDAIVTYDEFRKRFRASRMVAPALLKQGLAFKALGFRSDARTFFKELIRLYPNTPEAAQARKELDAL
jgi:tol-pal system protein YbgF